MTTTSQIKPHIPTIQPIIVKQRGETYDSQWITHLIGNVSSQNYSPSPPPSSRNETNKQSILKKRNNYPTTSLSGIMELQSLRRQHFRLGFRNFSITIHSPSGMSSNNHDHHKKEEDEEEENTTQDDPQGDDIEEEMSNKESSQESINQNETEPTHELPTLKLYLLNEKLYELNRLTNGASSHRHDSSRNYNIDTAPSSTIQEYGYLVTSSSQPAQGIKAKQRSNQDDGNSTTKGSSFLPDSAKFDIHHDTTNQMITYTSQSNFHVVIPSVIMGSSVIDISSFAILGHPTINAITSTVLSTDARISIAFQPIIHVMKEFEKSPSIFDKMILPKMSLRRNEDEKRLNSEKNVAITQLDVTKPLDLNLLEQYQKLAKRIWMLVKQYGNKRATDDVNNSNKGKYLLLLETTVTDELDYDTFKLALKFASICALDGRSKSLFNACDLDRSGLLSLTELEVALMINDVHPSHVDISSVYDVFKSFDIDNVESLSEAQFQECVKLLRMESSTSLSTAPTDSYDELDTDAAMKLMKDEEYLSKLFFENTTESERMNYETFTRVYCMDIIEDTKEEFKRRKLVLPKESTITSKEEQSHHRHRFGSFSSTMMKRISKRNSRKGIDYGQMLMDHMNSSYHKIISTFPSVREDVVRLRMDVQKILDEDHRSSRRVSNRQRRSTVIQESIRKREDKNLARRETLIRNMAKKKDDEASALIEKRREELLIQNRIEYLQDREDRNAYHDEIVRLTSADRLMLQEKNLEEIPPHLFANQASLGDLKIADISGNSIESLPGIPFIFHMTSLRKLCLTRNKLNSLPQEISALKNLELLYVDHNEFYEIPSHIHELESLQLVNLSHNHIESISDALCSLTKLKVLIAHSNRISDVSSKVNNLSSLQVLNLSRNILQDIPDNIGFLSKLIQADLSRNAILSLPVNFGSGLTSLEDLNISYNRIQDLPDSMSKLNSLCMINMEENKLEHLPGWTNALNIEYRKNCVLTISNSIGVSVSLCRLSLSMNKLEVLPPEIGLLKCLIHLNLQCNNLQQLPIEIGALTKLQTFNISHNHLRTLPHEFCLLESLLWLDLSHNDISELPESFFGPTSRVSKKLDTMNISHNRMKVFPPIISEISIPSSNTTTTSSSSSTCETTVIEMTKKQHRSNLTELLASSNSIQTIDANFCHYFEKTLQVLDLDSNCIEYLPTEISQMMGLTRLLLRNNKLKALPYELSQHPRLKKHEKVFQQHSGDNSNNDDTTMDTDSNNELIIDVSRNPMNELPTKFLSKPSSLPTSSSKSSTPPSSHPSLFHPYNHMSQQQLGYDYPAGYDNTQMKEWIREEATFYPLAVQEWKENELVYLSSESTVNDFIKGYMKRASASITLLEKVVSNDSTSCHASSSDSSSGSEHDNTTDLSSVDTQEDDAKKEMTDQTISSHENVVCLDTERIKQFYFECKRTGRVPIYSIRHPYDIHQQQLKEENEKVVKYQQHKEERFQKAKMKDLQTRRQIQMSYMGKDEYEFQGRCREVERRLEDVQVNRKQETDKALQDLRLIVQERENRTAEAKVERETEKRVEMEKETEKFNAIFDTNENKKRCFNIELDPCWKKDGINYNRFDV